MRIVNQCSTVVRSGNAILSMGVLMVMLSAGCSRAPAEKRDSSPPCGEQGVARIELGRPHGALAEFHSSGGDLYFTAYGFLHGGFGNPEVGLTRLFVGQGIPERVDPGERPEGTLMSVRVTEDDFEKLNLNPGTYWIVSSNYAEVAIVSCKADGVSVP